MSRPKKGSTSPLSSQDTPSATLPSRCPAGGAIAADLAGGWFVMAGVATCRLCGATLDPVTGSRRTVAEDPIPRDALTGWNDILEALAIKWTKADRLAKVKRLTRLAQKGILPITIHERGNGPPTASKRELVLAYNRHHDKLRSR